MKTKSGGILLSTIISLATAVASASPTVTTSFAVEGSQTQHRYLQSFEAPPTSMAVPTDIDNTTSSQSASRHTELSTVYSGTVESTHGVTFTLQNTLADASLILTGLGLNVETSPTTMSGAGIIAGAEGQCRVKLYTRSSQDWTLALDTSEVVCRGPEVETLVPDALFLKYFEDNWGGARRLKDHQNQGRQRRMQMGSGEEEMPGYPLVIDPGSSLEVYVVVFPVEGDTSGIQPILLSSTGTSDGALYTSDSMLSLYEGSSIVNGYLFDAVANGGSDTDIPSETKPTIFNGAIYYDKLSNSLSLSDYFKNLKYSLQPGSATLGYLGCDAELGTGYLDSIGSYGVMFDLISLVPQDSSDDENVAPMSKYAEIYGMDVYIRNEVNTSIEIYVRSNGGTEYMSYYEQTGQTNIAENWDLIAKGVIEGRGPDVGTPIPPEAWFKNVVLKPGDYIGFYVTVLDDPNLRYRKSDLAEGAIFSEDGNLGIGVGRSWGQYPLAGDGSDTYFANREFSGSFRYHAHEGICQSAAPSVAITSLAPVSSPDGMCVNSNTLKSTFQDGTGSYGALFDVVGKVAEIDWNAANQADVVVYARKGSWFGFQNDRDAWSHVLVNTTIFKPADFPNRDVTGPYISPEHKMTSGIIPESAFEPLTIKEGETWALYVLTSISDLRYTMGTSIGQVFASSPEIDILEGAGAADYPAFGSGSPEHGGIEYTFYAPRVFNGKLRYDYIAKCPTQAPSLSLAPTPARLLTTSVTYMFYVQYGPEIPTSAVPSDMESAVRGVLNGLMMDKTNDLNELVVNDGFFISSVSAGVVPPAKLGYLCVPTPPNLCTPVSVEVDGSHLPSAPTEQVAYYLYRQANTLPSLIDVNGYKIVYIGKKAVETNNEITLSGVPGREMGVSEQEFFAQALQDFLNSQVAADPSDEDGLQIISVSVDGQVIDTASTVARGQRRLESSNTINVKVKGQYRPPPEIDFGAIVEDSINADPERMANELKSPRPEIDGNDQTALTTNSDYFQEADVVGSKEIKEEIPTVIVLEDTTNQMKGTLNMMAGVVGVLIAILAAAFILRPHRRAAIFGSKSNEGTYLHTQDVDQESYLLDEKRAYRQPYHGDIFRENSG
ncbi:hypothetical protein HJC23_005932 [Cyclotella cryptica]|uniref:Uncharacterized protein n=1 Tax=Cyclotella cryptica TaxID=29204 RepID=A0ABD3QZP0_9STRA